MHDFYNYIKAFHLIFVITWFSGLFYIVRLFVYQIEAFHKTSPEKEIIGDQLKLMAHRLWFIISWPSAILTLLFALLLLYLNNGLLDAPWMRVKLCFVIALYIYQFKCHQIFKNLQNGIVKHSSNFMRLFNEIPTLILFSIIFLITLRHEIDWVFGVLSLLLLSLILMLLFKIYKRYRSNR